MDSAGATYLGEAEVLEGDKVVTGFLAKPFTMRDLHAALKSIETRLV
jgi:hypothetical protein